MSLGDGFYLAIGGGIGQHSWCHIHNILHDKQYDVKLEDLSEKMGMLSIQGPKRSVNMILAARQGVCRKPSRKVRGKGGGCSSLVIISSFLMLGLLCYLSNEYH